MRLLQMAQYQLQDPRPRGYCIPLSHFKAFFAAPLLVPLGASTSITATILEIHSLCNIVSGLHLWVLSSPLSNSELKRNPFLAYQMLVFSGYSLHAEHCLRLITNVIPHF